MDNIIAISGIFLFILFLALAYAIRKSYSDIKQLKKKDDELDRLKSNLELALTKGQFQDAIRKISQTEKLRNEYYEGLSSDEKDTVDKLVEGTVTDKALDDYFEDKINSTSEESQFELEVAFDKEFYNGK